jgi:hypothetical protein
VDLVSAEKLQEVIAAKLSMAVVAVGVRGSQWSWGVVE